VCVVVLVFDSFFVYFILVAVCMNILVWCDYQCSW